jgi:hypothetical protein
MASATVPPCGLRPMQDFDPSKPAVLHDRGGGKMIGWTGERCDDYRRGAVRNSDGTVSWDGLVLDGWGEALGG